MSSLLHPSRSLFSFVTVVGLSFVLAAAAPNGCIGSDGPASEGDEGEGEGEVSGGKKRIFITSTSFSGDLVGAASTGSGLDAADTLCTNVAAGALLGGTFKAWLSTSEANAIDRIEDVGPWFLPDNEESEGAKVFNNRGGLAAYPLVPIRRDELGRELSDPNIWFAVWNGTSNGGIASGDNCNGWTDTTSSFSASIGTTDRIESWTHSLQGPFPCDQRIQLYCLQQ